MRPAGVQARVALEDGALETPQRLAGLEPELAGEHMPALAVDVERLALPRGAVEREHEL